MNVWTIGHSTRTHEEVFSLLSESAIEILVDVRSYPSSRFCPQWNQYEIINGLPAGLAYYGLGTLLGGKRKALPLDQSVNGAWRNASFRGYGDYMQTPEFDRGLDELIDLAAQSRVAIMCAEAVWWKCHRSMISDALVARGHQALHILGPGLVNSHHLRDFAVVAEGRVSYPSDAA